MIDLITGHQGMPHISARQISDLNNSLMEGYGADKVMRMKNGTITLTNNDVFTVNPGYWRVNGYDMEIQQTETIQIERPTGNLKRYDDIYVEILRDIPSGAERAELVKVEGTPASSSPSHPPVPTEPELTTDTLLLCIPVGYVYATSTYTSKHDDTVAYHYVSETEYIELLTHLQQEQYSRARMSSGNFAPIRVEDIIKLNTKGTWTHTDPSSIGGYANDTYTLDSGNIVFQISSNGLGLKSILLTTSSTSGYTEKLILFKGEVAISSNNLWLPRGGSQMPSGLSAAAIVNGEEYSVGTGGYYVELPDGVLTELYIQATSGISGNTSFYPTIRYKDDPTYTSSYPPAPTNIMLWNEINDVKKDLLSEMSDNAPYLLRKGKGNLVDLVLEGYSLPINQILHELSSTYWSTESGVTASYSDGVATISSTTAGNGISTLTTYLQGHKYLIAISYKATAAITLKAGSSSFVGVQLQKAISSSKLNSWNTAYGVYNANSTNDGRTYIFSSETYSNLQIKNFMVIDLTQEFQTDIADHIYSKEQASAGSGIAWIKSYGFFSKDYEPYNLGSIQSVKTSGRKVVGKNLLNPDKIVQGNPSNPSAPNRCSTMGDKSIPVNVGDKITVSRHSTSIRYAVGIVDNSGNALYDSGWRTDTSISITAGYSGYLILGGFSYSDNANISPNDVKLAGFQIEFGTTSTAYEPYTSTTVALPNEDLRGILLRDGDTLYAYGDTDKGDGQKNVRFIELDLGDYTFTAYDATNKVYSVSLVSADVLTGTMNLTCSKGYERYGGLIENITDKSMRLASSGKLYIRDTAYTDATAFNTAMNGVKLVVEAYTPTTEASTPWQNPQRAYLDGTEEFIDNRDVPLPVGNTSNYRSSETFPPIQNYVDSSINILRENLKSIAAASSDFADFKTRIASL